MTLEMEGQRLGVEAEPALDGNALLVKNIQSGGAVAVWNLNNPPSKGVCPGDYVLSINDITGAAKMIEECKAGRKRLVLMVEGVSKPDLPPPPPGPAHKFQVNLDMAQGLKMGMDMDWKSDPRCIIIKDVKADGAVGYWNRGNPPHLNVAAGDRIVGVNRVEGDAKAMINEGTNCFKQRMQVVLKVESMRQPNLIVTPGTIPRNTQGIKRPAPLPEGADEIDNFIAKWGLTPDTGGFIRQQKPPMQKEIMDGFYCEEGHRDPIGKFFSFARRIINANNPQFAPV